MARASLLSGASLALLLASAVIPAAGLRHIQTSKFQDQQASAYTLSEGFMSPAGEGEPAATMSVDGDLVLSTAFPQSGDEFLHVMFLNEFNIESIGYPAPGLGGVSQQTRICCTDELFEQGVCGLGTRGGVIQTPVADGVQPAAITSIPISSEITPVSESFTVTQEGVQTIVVSMCSASGSITTATLSAAWTFKASYGFLPSRLMAFLVYNTVLTACTGVYLVLLGGLLVYNRQHIILLQGILVLVGFVTLIEHSIWTTALQQHNTSGVPFTDPTPVVIYAASFLTALKQALSLSMLLAVCLGFGAVVPTLPRSVSLAIGGLAALFFGFSTAFEATRLSANSTGDSTAMFLAIPVILLNALFLLWIAGALRITTRALESGGQNRKLEMYKTLLYTFVVCLGLVVVVTAVDLLDALGIVNLPEFIVVVRLNLWGIIYFVMLVAVTVIWRPGQRTAAFSVYAEAMDSEQMADEMEQDDDDEGARASVHSDSPGPQPTATSGEADTTNVDVELAVLGESAEPSATPGRVTRTEDSPTEEARSPVV